MKLVATARHTSPLNWHDLYRLRKRHGIADTTQDRKLRYLLPSSIHRDINDSIQHYHWIVDCVLNWKQALEAFQPEFVHFKRKRGRIGIALDC